VLERRQGLNFRVNMKARGDTFGEVSLMYNVPRSATVAATRDAVVWVLERDQFRCCYSAALPAWALLPPRVCAVAGQCHAHPSCIHWVQLSMAVT
jgi:CRP-like cAMP-binding protein